MKFFKAFSLLHRRTKSETFTTGYIPPNQGSFAVSKLNSRPSSLPAGLGSNKEVSSDISSVFDFATANFTPVSTNFNYLRGINHAATTSPHRASQNGLSSLLVEENMRLRDSLDLWFSECSKAEQLLQHCRAELAFERDKNLALHQQTTRDQELITDLKKDISRYEQRFENSRDPGSTNQCSRSQSNVPNASPNALLLPGSSDSATSLAISTKIRTLDEYTSALRMTLSTRRLLRDQKKVSKFWKNTALGTGKCEDIITPSTSAISSVHDTLSPERKRAIDALIRERGWPYPQIQPAEQVDNSSSEPPSKASLSEDMALSRIHPVSSIAATLQSTSSNNSVGSRLAPLASESLKAEINLLFGIQRPSPSPSKKCQLAAIPSFNPSKTVGESPSRLGNILKATFSFGSYGDLSQRFSNLFSQGHVPRVKLPATGAEVETRQNLEPDAEQLPLPSSSCLAESSAPSGSSRIFGEALALLKSQHDTGTSFNFQPVNIDEDEIKPLRSGRSWQKYLGPAAQQIPSKIRVPKKKVFAGKENGVLVSKPSSIVKKSSKIQTPIFAKD